MNLERAFTEPFRCIHARAGGAIAASLVWLTATAMIGPIGAFGQAPIRPQTPRADNQRVSEQQAAAATNEQQLRDRLTRLETHSETLVEEQRDLRHEAVVLFEIVLATVFGIAAIVVAIMMTLFLRERKEGRELKELAIAEREQLKCTLSARRTR